MTYQLFRLPKAVALDTSANPYPGAKLNFYLTTTSTPTDTYTTSALSVAHANPVVADSAGVFPAIYLDPSITYKVTYTTSANVLIYTIDPVNDQVLSQITIGQYLYPRTAAEISAGKTPTNYYVKPCSPRRYGAAATGSGDDIVPIRDAIAVAAVTGGITYVDLEGLAYKVSDTVYPLTNTVVCNGEIRPTSGFTAGKAVCQLGVTGGGTLVRPAGFEKIRVVAFGHCTAQELVGFRFDCLVRSSWINDCYAEMAEDANGTRFHVGCEFVAHTQANAVGGATGVYENFLRGFTGYNAYAAVVMRTRGTPSEQLADPECNGNEVEFMAYSCIHSAIIIEEGCVENNIRFRADTFPSQLGAGTTIIVADVRGLYNYIDMNEEVGLRADTQYSGKWGTNAAFNTVTYETKQVATARWLDSATSKTNVLKFKRPTQNFGGDTSSFSHYAASVADPTSDVKLTSWIAPAPCVLLRASARLDANLAGGTVDLFFAKNGTSSADNRIRFSTGEGTTSKHLDGNPSVGTAIDSELVFAKGDRIDIRVTNSGGGTANAAATFTVRFLSTEADG